MSTDNFITGLQSAIGSYAQASDNREARKQRQKELDLGYRAQGLLAQYDDNGNVTGLIKDPEMEIKKQDEYKRDIMAKAALEGREAQFDESGLLARAPRTRDELDYLKAKENADPMSNMLKTLQLQKAQAESAQLQKGTKLAPDKVLLVQQGAQIPTQLKAIGESLDVNKDIFGPMKGRLKSFNPYDTQAQSIDAQMRAAAQSFGRYMEGGVLRKEDEEKYKKMFPSLSDTPDLAKNKLAIVNKMLVDKQNADLQALRAQGYDTSGFESLPEAQLPGSLTKQARPGLIKGMAPQGANAQQMSVEDQQAMDWARSNPNDPRAKKIMETLGGR